MVCKTSERQRTVSEDPGLELVEPLSSQATVDWLMKPAQRELIRTIAIEAHDPKNVAKARAICKVDPEEEFAEVLSDVILGRIDRGSVYILA